MSISIQAYRAIMPFVNEEESAQLLATAPQIIPEVIDNLKLALNDKDHYSSKYKSFSLTANGLLLLLGQMAASHESCAEKMVSSGLLPLILSFLQSNPDTYYWSVRRAAEFLWTLVQVGKDKYLPVVKKLAAIQPRIFFRLHIGFICIAFQSSL